MAVLANRVRVTTSTTGTGTITLGSAATTYQTFAEAGVANGAVVRYLIEEGTNWEIGTGTYTSSGTTLSRTPSESSNGGSAITLAGNATVSIVAASQDITSGVAITGGTINNVVIGGTTAAAANFTNVTLSGDLTVNGTTTTINTTNTVVTDNLIELNNGATSNANDSGIVIERGSTGDNAFMGWDESADSFIVGTTTATGSSTGDLTITAAPLSVSTLDATGNITVGGTVDGRDIATDGTKLDGIESGATADQTASEILTAIKTVDGATSGLDADLLDGQEGSYYLNTSTSFGGDVSGTYNAIVVADDSHNHVISNVDGLQTALDGKQTLDAGLTDIAGLAVTDGNIIVGDGTNWVAESGATARASLDVDQAGTAVALAIALG